MVVVRPARLHSLAELVSWAPQLVFYTATLFSTLSRVWGSETVELICGGMGTLTPRVKAGFAKRCRHSWLTNSVLVYEPNCGGGGCLPMLTHPISEMLNFWNAEFCGKRNRRNKLQMVISDGIPDVPRNRKLTDLHSEPFRWKENNPDFRYVEQNRSKLSEFPSEPFSGRENNAEFRSLEQK